MSSENAKGFGLFVPTTSVWDVQELYTIDINSDQFRELLVRLYQNVNNIATALNIKDSAYYNTQEFVNGQLFFPNPNYTAGTTPSVTYRQVLRLTINFGALPNTGTKSVAHGITCTAQTTFTRIYGAASDTTGLNYIPLPNANAQITVNATNVTVTTTANLSAFNITYIILEYLQT